MRIGGTRHVGSAEAAVTDQGRTNGAALAAIALSSGSTRPSSAPDGETRAEHARSSEVVSRAMHGDPLLMVGVLVARMKEHQQKAREADVASCAERSEDAREAQLEAIKKAQKAAEEASGFLGLGEVGNVIATVAGVTAAVVAGIATGGAALAVVGAVLLSSGDLLAQGLADAGVIPEDVADDVAAGLKVTGGLLMGGGALATAAIAGGVAMSTYADEATQVLVDAGVVSEEAGRNIALGLSLAGTVLAGVGAMAAGPATGTGEASAGAKVAIGAAQWTERGARVFAAGMNLGGAVKRNESDHRQADATQHGSRAEEAEDDAEACIDDLKDEMKGLARALRLLHGAAEARGEALRAAASTRA